MVGVGTRVITVGGVSTRRWWRCFSCWCGEFAGCSGVRERTMVNCFRFIGATMVAVVTGGGVGLGVTFADFGIGY